MNETIKLSLALALICAVASSVLAFAHKTTKPIIEKREAAQRSDALGKVLPEFDNDPCGEGGKAEIEHGGQTFAFYRARKSGKLVGLAGEGTTGQGFGGEIKILIGIGTDGTVGTVLVTGHKETPGLGTKVTDRTESRSIWDLFGSSACSSCPSDAAKVPPSDHLDQYSKGLNASAAPFKVEQDGGTIDAVSGATVSSRAVADAVSLICQAFEANKTDILGQ